MMSLVQKLSVIWWNVGSVVITHNLPKAEADQKYSKSRVHVYKMSCKFKKLIGKSPFMMTKHYWSTTTLLILWYVLSTPGRFILRTHLKICDLFPICFLPLMTFLPQWNTCVLWSLALLLPQDKRGETHKFNLKSRIKIMYKFTALPQQGWLFSNPFQPESPSHLHPP